ncbi:MAG: asparagine synthase-related protein, partial [Oscillospiraceae bacterium]
GLWQLLFLMPAKINGTGVFKNILELKPAQCGVFSSDGLRLWSYWQLEAKESRESRTEILEHTRFLLTDAIKRQLVSDAPLCTFLSGGLDSSLITSVAAKEYEKSGMTLSTYSFEYEDNKKYFKSTLFQPQGDDEYALYFADYLKTHHHVLIAPVNEIAEKLTDAVYYRDLPGQADIDSSLLYFCSLVKNEHTVGISGECADESGFT